MIDVATLILLECSIFAGAVVSGLAGFAFSGVAGIILLRIFQPIEAVPLMMACSIVVQAMTYWSLRKNIQWQGNFCLTAGGLFGIAIAG